MTDMKGACLYGANAHANKSDFNNDNPLDWATQKLVEEIQKPIIR